MTGRTLRPSAVLAASAALLFALAACGGSGGPTVESKAQRSLSSVGPCPDFVLCIRGDHWDSLQCRCVPNEDDAGSAMSDSGGDASDDGASSTDACSAH